MRIPPKITLEKGLFLIILEIVFIVFVKLALIKIIVKTLLLFLVLKSIFTKRWAVLLFE